MRPSVYLYRKNEGVFELYLGEFSTLEGLKLVDPNLNTKLICAGATSYKKYGWATEKELPDFRKVRDVIAFFEREEEFGLINFELQLTDFGILDTHDDGECHFKVRNKKDIINLINMAAPQNHRGLILSTLLENPDKYIELDKNDKVTMHYSFDEYLKESKTYNNT